MSPAEDQPAQAEKPSTLEGAKASVTKASVEDTVVEAPTSEPEPAAAPSGDKPFPLADAGEYYKGLWSGKVPIYGCPYCAFTTNEGSNTVAWHIAEKADAGNKNHAPALTTPVK